MRSAAKKECSKCGKEWCFKAHAASLIPLDPLPLVLLSQKRVFIHLRPYLSAIRVSVLKAFKFAAEKWTDEKQQNHAFNSSQTCELTPRSTSCIFRA